MQIIYENNNLRITYEKGNNQTLVVAFTGVELRLGDIQKEEFQKTLNSLEEENHICYVIDKQRSWYNFLEDEITEHLNQLISKISAEKVVTLGNSMGGYGAIIFAKRFLNCQTAIAFCPQYSIHPEIAPFETRWQQYTKRLENFSIKDISTKIADDISYNLFFGNLEKRDKKHKQLFEALSLSNIKINNIEGATHNVALHLKQQGKLGEVISTLVENGIIKKV